jgi:hypothetical protein
MDFHSPPKKRAHPECVRSSVLRHRQENARVPYEEQPLSRSEPGRLNLLSSIRPVNFTEKNLFHLCNPLIARVCTVLHVNKKIFSSLPTTALCAQSNILPLQSSCPFRNINLLMTVLRLFILILASAPLLADNPLQKTNHWAYQPITPTNPPTTSSSWPRTDIDKFIYAKQATEKLTPAPNADKTTLIRRIYFDLIGLPPTPAQIDSFLNDTSPAAYENLVDQLLASPHFGERWGRHWLDVARFAESVTLRGLVFNHAWRYRDYVIDSYNRDLPFNRFVTEQIAGDLLPTSSIEEAHRARAATTYLVLGNFNYEEQDKDQLRMDIVDEQLDTIGKGLLGQTLGCARCHDHKFDPIPARDYYALAGILRNVKSAEHANVSTWLDLPLPLPPEQEEQLKEHEHKIAELNRAIRKETESIAQATNEKNLGTASADPAEKSDELNQLRRELKQLTDSGPKRPVVMSVKEESTIDDTHIHLRGNVHNLGEKIPRGFLSVTARHMPDAPAFSTTKSGRRELAAWITDPKNPLTARVYVNRVWLWLLGTGLVCSPDNFGTTGESPTHPELLDFLAHRFITNGWSTKKLVREIVLSRVYQLASTHAESARDPENHFYARANRRRLEAESLRDAILSISGRLDLTTGGPTFKPGTAADFGYSDESLRRSVYVPAFRNALPQIFELFDFADTSVVTGQRPSSIISPQALYFMNHPFILQNARAAADCNKSTDRATLAYRQTLGRFPSASELTLATDHLSSQTDQTAALAELYQSLFASPEFRLLN